MSDILRKISSYIAYIRGYLLKETGDLNILGKLAKTVFIVFFTDLLIKIIHKLIDKAGKKMERGESLSSRRSETLRKTFKSIVRVLIWFFGIMTILDIFKVDTKSIIATAGIGGIAIGFGAQSLVKDVITGFFILQENLFVVGDYVRIKSLEGYVEELGLKTTKIRDLNGELHIIPNGEIQIITNLSRGAVRALVNATIAYEEDLEEALRVLQKICDDINMEYENIIARKIYIRGVEKLSDIGVDIRLEGMVKNMKHWDIEREVNRRVKEEFARRNIEIPYKKLVLYRGD